MTVLFPSGTQCPVIGSACVLSAVSLQDAMKTLVHLVWCICVSCDKSRCPASILVWLCLPAHQLCSLMFFSGVIRNTYFHFLITSEVGIYL